MQVKHRERCDLALWCLTTLMVAALVGFSLVACRLDGASEADTIFADGTRHCKQTEAPVSLWDLPGGVPSGAKNIGEIPHGTHLTILERASRFGIDYYLVEYEGTRGWIPYMFTKEVEPLCREPSEAER